jgi:hypothetical protein
VRSTTLAARSLGAVMLLLGSVAVVAGAYAVITGVDGMPGGVSADDSVDSELRFFGTFYVVFGAAAVWLSARVTTQTRALRIWALTLFFAGVARAISWLDVGRPDDLFVALMVVELTIAPAVVVWQAAVRDDSG